MPESVCAISIIVIAVVRRYMRFLEFRISGAYVDELTSHGAMTEFINLYVSPLFNLRSPGGRRGVVDNIVAIITRENGKAEARDEVGHS